MTKTIGMHERRRVFVLAVDIPDDGRSSTRGTWATSCPPNGSRRS